MPISRTGPFCSYSIACLCFDGKRLRGRNAAEPVNAHGCCSALRGSPQGDVKGLSFASVGGQSRATCRWAYGILPFGVFPRLPRCENSKLAGLRLAYWVCGDGLGRSFPHHCHPHPNLQFCNPLTTITTPAQALRQRALFLRKHHRTTASPNPPPLLRLLDHHAATGRMSIPNTRGNFVEAVWQNL